MIIVDGWVGCMMFILNELYRKSDLKKKKGKKGKKERKMELEEKKGIKTKKLKMSV